ncbi:hypothetical protein P389DRAFT_166473 [Cystobasidium minutum MCA 4210]|uniref:uncharacterized protein n=1 Tax=Cystobasidium minutum MCA 4210 TaxID=1397322 RepID=UPI0034CDFB67|eukprot:jgi/Rhomi1/166473/fgenesh1_kg.2_\
MTIKTTAIAALSLLACSSILVPPTAVNAQGTGEDPMAVWYWTGAQSVYWHTRYHGCLAMAAYGDYNTTCPRHFTYETLQRQYPGNTNEPFEVVGTWGPTPKYGSEGFMVRVPEMNKILMVFKGIYGWENFNATLSPLLGVGCNSTCMAHTGAIEAWQEVKEATNDMAIIKRRQGDLVWSAAGHGFGGMIMQVAALDLKVRGFLFSAQSFGSPPVFNVAAARRWDDLFVSDASQRTVANRDAVPAKIPYHNKYNITDGTVSNSSYAFVNTGIHVWNNASINEAPMGTANMYGQNYVYCLDNNEDPRCAGGDNEEDHYFYFTDIGTCCETGWTARYNATFDREALLSDQSAYEATATVPRLDVPNTSVAPPTSTSSSVEGVNATSSAGARNGTGVNATAGLQDNANNRDGATGVGAGEIGRGAVNGPAVLVLVGLASLVML